MSLGSPSNIRSLAWTILGQCLAQDHFASELIDRTILKYSLTSEDRRLLTQIVYGTLRGWGFLSNIIHERLRGKTSNKFIHLMGLSAYQLLFLRKVPDHAVLNEAVNLAKSKGGEGMGRLVNAVLRKLQEDRGNLLLEWESPAGQEATFPKWLWSRWLERWGEAKALELAKAFNRVPATFARVNLSRTTRGAFVRKFAEEWMKVDLLGEGPMVILPPRAREKANSLLEEGLISLQDYHSYQVVEGLDPQPGEKGVDACAGHGGKAAAIMEKVRQNGELWVYDPAVDQRTALKKNFKRLHLKMPHILMNFNEKYCDTWDWALIDAPCSGLGTLGRKPEIRWKRSEADLLRHQARQIKILNTWSQGVRVGGRILYSVCSLEPEESTQVTGAFLGQVGGGKWDLEESRELWPGAEGEDGFYWARLRRKS